MYFFPSLSLKMKENKVNKKIPLRNCFFCRKNKYLISIFFVLSLLSQDAFIEIVIKKEFFYCFSKTHSQSESNLNVKRKHFKMNSVKIFSLIILTCLVNTIASILNTTETTTKCKV